MHIAERSTVPTVGLTDPLIPEERTGSSEMGRQFYIIRAKLADGTASKTSERN